MGNDERIDAEEIIKKELEGKKNEIMVLIRATKIIQNSNSKDLLAKDKESCSEILIEEIKRKMLGLRLDYEEARQGFKEEDPWSDLIEELNEAYARVSEKSKKANQ